MRIPGFAGKAFSEAGGSAENIPAGELYQAIEKNTIDALEWVGPWNDSIMGFPDVAKYYYSPGWHEPGPTLELIINQKAWDELPDDLKAIIESAAATSNIKMLSEYEAKNSEFLAKIKNSGKVEFRTFPPEILTAFRKSTEKFLNEKASENPEFKEVYESFNSFKKMIAPWTNMADKAFLEIQK